jgi:hypothetical protein
MLAEVEIQALTELLHRGAMSRIYSTAETLFIDSVLGRLTESLESTTQAPAPTPAPPPLPPEVAAGLQAQAR